ncbi:UvrD-helicase domain-containing protein [Endothiovibrio diazotrophicus]
MRTLLYNELNPKKIPNFAKIRKALENDDFRAAQVKKIGDNLYRARLDKSNRLLFSLYKYEGEVYALILECIENHAYDRSRFLRGGATVDEEKIPDVPAPEASDSLVHNSRNLYYAMGYANEAQEISFLSFDDYLASIRVPQGKELPFRRFAQWFARHKVPKSLRDPYQIFEEFKGVITGPTESAWLSREAYLQLGVRQSIFRAGERELVYDLFEKYLDLMREENGYDANILSYEYLQEVEPRYDFIVVDEVQDLTAVQLQLVLKSLRDPRSFLLCGDPNQIVHPNFFSWAKVKSLLHAREEEHHGPAELIRILNTNYRNSPQVTAVANTVLKIKSNRFGSVDKESNYLVHSNAHNSGTVILLNEEPERLRELDQKTSRSTRFAVIVMHPEQKTRAKQLFRTPLVFSIQEAKGLEYENVILYNFVSAEEERFREITRGVSADELNGDELRYARAKDKADKSLEIYKFHVNALYVALTRAVRNLYLIERAPGQRLFELLELRESTTGLDLEAYRSDQEEWRREAHRLAMQGKEEQAEEIRRQILEIKEVPWPVLTGDAVAKLRERAIDGNDKKAKLLLFEYALVYHHRGYLNDLLKAHFRPALNPDKGLKPLNQKYYTAYDIKHTHGIKGDPVRRLHQRRFRRGPGALSRSHRAAAAEETSVPVRHPRQERGGPGRQVQPPPVPAHQAQPLHHQSRARRARRGGVAQPLRPVGSRHAGRHLPGLWRSLPLRSQRTLRQTAGGVPAIRAGAAGTGELRRVVAATTRRAERTRSSRSAAGS